jgi:two-component system chemotaxis response regulator CheY
MKALTILVAEDDLLSRMVLERSIVQWGYQLASATDGEAARQLLQTRNIDVCIMDWEMPKLTGVQVCQWLRNGNQTNVPYVILITSKDQPEDIQAGYEAGADDYITKPCDLKYLRRRIATVAEKLQRQNAWLEHARNQKREISIAGLNPLDIYLSDLRLMRRKT